MPEITDRNSHEIDPHEGAGCPGPNVGCTGFGRFPSKVRGEAYTETGHPSRIEIRSRESSGGGATARQEKKFSGNTQRIIPDRVNPI